MKTTWIRLVYTAVLALPTSFGCSPSQPAPKVRIEPPAIQSNQSADPSTDLGSENLQQQLAGVLVPSLNFPEVEGFERGEINQFEDPRAGYSLAYDSSEPKITVTVYVYNRGLTSIPNGIESELAKAQVDEVEQALPEMVRRGHYTSFKRRGDGEKPFGISKALWRSFELGSAEGSLNSEVYVTAFQNSFIKVRGTYSTESAEACEKKVTELIARLGEILQPGKDAE